MKAVLVGATGLTGSYLLEHLLNDDYFEKVIALTRKPLQIINKRYFNIVVNFNNYADLQNAFAKDAVIFVTIGTTQKQVGGDKVAYRKVDFDIPVNIAKIAREKGVKIVVLVSVVGANANAASFYTRLKGEVENAISSLGIDSVYFMKPSILLGHRKEWRLAERMAQAVMIPLSSLFFGRMSKFKGIHVKDLSLAMLKAAKVAQPGIHLLHYQDMMEMVHS